MKTKQFSIFLIILTSVYTLSTPITSAFTVTSQSNVTITAIVGTTGGTTSGTSTGGSSGGGGGGGFMAPSSSNDNSASVKISGLAFPLAKLYLYTSGQLIKTGTANSNGNFVLTVSGLASGSYNFTLFAEDINGDRTKGITFGPVFNSVNIVEVNGVITGDVIQGNKLKKDEPTDLANCIVKRGDLNCDSKTSIVDLSILTYWFKKSNFPVKYDLNKDGKIDIIDLSILVFYWNK